MWGFLARTLTMRTFAYDSSRCRGQHDHQVAAMPAQVTDPASINRAARRRETGHLAQARRGRSKARDPAGQACPARSCAWTAGREVIEDGAAAGRRSAAERLILHTVRILFL